MDDRKCPRCGSELERPRAELDACPECGARLGKNVASETQPLDLSEMLRPD
jgi:predicted  nucleic acid-binding Zn-ribbon protein